MTSTKGEKRLERLTTDLTPQFHTLFRKIMSMFLTKIRHFLDSSKINLGFLTRPR